MPEPQIDITVNADDAEMNHEKVVGDFFEAYDAALDAEKAAEEPSEELEVVEGDETPTDAVSTDEEHSEGDQDEDEDSDDDSDDEEEAAQVPDQWDKRFRDQQSFYDKKLAEVTGQLEQMNQWAQTVYQQQMAQHQAQLQAQAQQAPAADTRIYSDAEIAGAVSQNYEQAFVYAATQRPDLMPRVVAAARADEKLGHAVADEMMFEYSKYQLSQQQKAIDEAREAAVAQREADLAPAQVQETMGQLVKSVADQYGDAFTAVQDDFITRAQETAPAFREYMEKNGHEMTPDAVRSFLVQTLLDVREQKLNALAAKPRKPKKLSPKEAVESSTSADGSRPEDMSADELAIHELMSGAKELGIDMSTPN